MIWIKSKSQTLTSWVKSAGKFKLVLITVPSLFLIVVLWSVSAALLAPGTDPVSARLAEWGRNHYLSSLVSAL